MKRYQLFLFLFLIWGNFTPVFGSTLCEHIYRLIEDIEKHGMEKFKVIDNGFKLKNKDGGSYFITSRTLSIFSSCMVDIKKSEQTFGCSTKNEIITPPTKLNAYTKKYHRAKKHLLSCLGSKWTLNENKGEKETDNFKLETTSAEFEHKDNSKLPTIALGMLKTSTKAIDKKIIMGQLTLILSYSTE